MRRWITCVLPCCLLAGQALAEDAGVQQTTVGRIIVRSARAANVRSIADVCLGTVPGPLADSRVVTFPFDRRNNTEAEGRIEIELKRDLPLYVAVSWANDPAGEWSKEAMSKADFIRAGWMLVGDLPTRSSSGKTEYRGLYWRAGKRGEKFRIRTRKAVAPIVIDLPPGAARPTAAGVDFAGTSLPPRVPPSAAVELTCGRALLPVAADKFCALKGMPFLEDAILYAYPYRPKENDPDDGRLSIQVKQDTSLLIAASWEEGESSEPWAKEVSSRDALRKAGWTLVGALILDDPEIPALWVYWRPCRAGERLVLRTRKAHPPMVLVPRDAQLNPTTSVLSESMDPGVYRGVLAARVDYLVAHRRWRDLEKTVAEFRRSKQRLPNGTELLRAFYEGCMPLVDTQQNDAKQQLLEAWLAAQPRSIAAHVALARFFESRAWQARGCGFGYQVTAEGGRLFDQYVAQSEKLAEKAAALTEKDPCLYDVQVQLAIDLGYPREKLKQILLDCAALDPQHTIPFTQAARYFQTRWHGAPGDVERYARWAAEQTRAKGDLVYFYIVREMQVNHGSAVLDEYHFDWQRVKQGALDVIQMHPTSPAMHGVLAELAFFQGDRATARQALEKFGQSPAAVAKWHGTPVDLLRRWARDDYLQGDQQAVFEVTRSPIDFIDWSHETNQWLVFDNNGDLLRVDSETGKRIGANRGSGHVARVVAIIDKMAIAASWHGKIYSIGVAGGGAQEIGEHQHLTDAMLSGDGRYWVTASPDGILRFWDLARDTKPEDCDTRPSLVQSLTSLPADQGFITGDRDGKLELWSLYGRKRTREIGQLRSGTKMVRVSPDGKLLAAASRGMLTLWQLPEGKKVADVSGPSSVNVLTFSPDGKWLAAATGNMQPVADGNVWLWDTNSGRKAAEFRGHKAMVRALAFDVESRSLVSGGDDMTLRVWKIPR